MTNGVTEERIYKEAERRVKAKKEFYRDLITWAAVNTVLVIIWYLSGQGYPWFFWPLGIWGAFVVFHYLRVFVFERRSDIKEIEREADKIRRE